MGMGPTDCFWMVFMVWARWTQWWTVFNESGFHKWSSAQQMINTFSFFTCRIVWRPEHHSRAAMLTAVMSCVTDHLTFTITAFPREVTSSLPWKTLDADFESSLGCWDAVPGVFVASAQLYWQQVQTGHTFFKKKKKGNKADHFDLLMSRLWSVFCSFLETGSFLHNSLCI